MKLSVLFTVTIIPLIICLPTLAEEWQETRSWDASFLQHQVKGVVVLWNENKQLGVTNDLHRASQSFLPASTFKIPNGLIALELAIVKDEQQVFKWDGQSRDFSNWNRDYSLVTAMRYSFLPGYQEFARQVGAERMAKMLAAFKYGNENISGNIDSFWVDGGLRISATEQINFLRKLYHNQLPISERSQRIVKQTMLTEANGEYIIRAKTGHAVRVEPNIGWWVGWVELDDNVWFFAMNMDTAPVDKSLLSQAIANGLSLRQTITKEILRLEHIIP